MRRPRMCLLRACQAVAGRRGVCGSLTSDTSRAGRRARGPGARRGSNVLCGCRIRHSAGRPRGSRCAAQARGPVARAAWRRPRSRAARLGTRADHRRHARPQRAAARGLCRPSRRSACGAPTRRLPQRHRPCPRVAHLGRAAGGKPPCSASQGFHLSPSRSPVLNSTRIVDPCRRHACKRPRLGWPFAENRTHPSLARAVPSPLRGAGPQARRVQRAQTRPSHAAALCRVRTLACAQRRATRSGCSTSTAVSASCWPASERASK